jgi:ribonucleoside-diphosphate reductase alpha chain
MIKVVKRDGSVEPFQIEKINSWWMWASKRHNIPLGEGLEAVQRAVRSLSQETTSEKIQRALITELIALKRWSTVMMAGTLEASLVHKRVHGNTVPSAQAHFTNLLSKGYAVSFPLNQQEWDEINKLVDHQRDFAMPQFAIRYIMDSYALGNVVTNERVETPQFIYLRMAIAVGCSYPEGERLEVIKDTYELLSTKVISAPTPNFTHLGTSNNGLASCCLYGAGDDRKSLAAANLITYVMTYSSAGLGYHQNVRSVGDPVRGGKIEHQGEMFYLKSNAANAAANRQAKRGGAINAFLPAYSKEIDYVLAGREPTASPGKALNGIDISLVLTRDFIRRAVKSQPAICFSEYSHPEMFKSMYSGDPAELEALMTDAVAQNLDANKLINPRATMGNLGRVTVSTGRNFAFLTDNANYHTPFKDPITGSNLCMEIMNPVKPYKEISDLWRTDDDVEGEVSMCNLGAVNHDLVADNPELHKRACKALLRMIDYCIHYGYYELTHIGYTAKKRMNAAVGVMNTATYMARKHLRFDSPEGLKSVSEFAERHMYYLIESSLELGKEKGNAPWMHKTKWSGYTNKNGEYISAWMPIDTQNKRLANELGLKPTMPWEDLRARVAANKGIRNSVLAGMMPGESSSKALGAANSIYPIRETGLSKTDSTTAIDWCAVGAGEAEYDYQLAFTMSTLATTKYYAAWQMWVDGGISGDYWLPFEKGQNVIEIDDILEKYSQMYAYGLKSHYYTVPKTQKSNKEKDTLMNSLLNKGVDGKKLVINPDTGYPNPTSEFIHDGRALEDSAITALKEDDESDDRFYDGSGCSGGACSI